MAYVGLREFISELAAAGELVQVDEPVHWHIEVGAFARKMADLKGGALLFTNIEDYGPGRRLFVNSVGTNRRFALALGLPAEATEAQVIETFAQRIKTRVPPREVATGACKENIVRGEQIDVLYFPVPHWHEKDGGRYIGTWNSVVFKDRDSDWVNVGLYRNVVHERNQLGILPLPAKHFVRIMSKYHEHGEPMPVAIAIGAEPVLPIVAATPFEYGVSEYDMAGALRQAPLDIVRCETSDLLVPADAEIVIEGHLNPGELREEGPFGEFTGYYGGVRAPRPVVHVDCITHRDDPILTGSFEGKPVVEDHIHGTVVYSALMKNHLDAFGLGVRAVYTDPWSATFMVVASMKPKFVGHTYQVASAIWSMRLGIKVNWVITVDEDIDATNLHEVWWAISTRCKGDRDIFILPRNYGHPLHPCLTPDERKAGMGFKVHIDACWPADWPEDETWKPPVCDWNSFPEEVRRSVEAKLQRLGK